MALFRRRRAAGPLTTPDAGAETVETHRTTVTTGVPAVPSPSRIDGTAGWAGIGVRPVWDQVGAYRGSLLTQFPALLPGPQLHSGREWGTSEWMTPPSEQRPNGSVQLTQVPVNVPGGLLTGSPAPGPLGALSSRVFQSRVTAAQVQQSGLAAQQWAQTLDQ